MSSYTSLPSCILLKGCWEIEGINAAWYELPTERYQHGVLGDAIEGTKLNTYAVPTADHIFTNSCGEKSVTLDDDHVFEDTKPRLVDLNGDGKLEVIVVRSHHDRGAQLAIYADHPDERNLVLVAATPYIGTRNRWLAPIGAADLDGDGFIEIAYIDRPHLAKTLRVWRYKDGDFSEIAAASGLSNHRIGEDFISGGIRDCGQGPEMITASANWTRVMATRLENGSLRAQDIGPLAGRDSFTQALACQAVR
ncbi:VCBS repeat-containing protein [Cognatiyoonia sp. IB215182]|uniref:FG-GAP repeat domain-containing protein n=1 Tax=Cognatiyoonia sp. IB215182 TaxID=3097353 RepID=UPI002A17AD80|nr:VCBS repeat-containing protein [Cognatiyoonia sp. IB215182]MDX8351245.1 VCBS repeat-containing protein [Cognatiyoonia sp. IB215182]